MSARDSVTDDLRLSERVRARFSSQRPGVQVSDLVELPGGHSGRTYKVSVGDDFYVVKAVPAGRPAIGRHDMLRQARALEALQSTNFPAPRVVIVDDVEPAWFAMTFAPGEAVEPVLDNVPIAEDLAATRMRRASALMVDFHAFDPHALGLRDAALTPKEELERWSKLLNAVPEELVPDGLALRDRLASVIPESVAPTLVHGDFRLGNILFEEENPTALIDWEIWSVGDPRVEMGWFALFSEAANFPGVGEPVTGLPTADELVQIYRDLSGRTESFEWFLNLGRFKMATIMAHNLVRHRQGRHDDPEQELLPETIEHLIRGGILATSLTTHIHY